MRPTVILKALATLVLGLAVAISVIASSGQGSHIVVAPQPLVFGETANFAWNGSGDDVSFIVTCVSNATTAPSEPLGTVVQSGSAMVLEDGMPLAFSLPMGPTANWTAGGADCTVQADIFSYSGGSGNYQRKFATSTFTVAP